MLLSVVIVGFMAAIFTVPWAVDRSVAKRWTEIIAMMDRALMHGGSLDTLSRRLKRDSDDTRTLAAGALEISRTLKDRVEHHEKRLKDIEAHPIFRPLGGPGTLEEQ
jgi:hypothetical protein